MLGWIEAQHGELSAREASLRGQFDQIVDGSQWSRDDDEHDPEGTTIAFERAKVVDLLDWTRRELAELAAARQRVADGSYGRCERCGGPIAPGRLSARPAARLCIGCANRSPGR